VFLDIVQSPYASAAILPQSHPLSIKKTAFHQPNIITWREYVDMKTSNTTTSSTTNNNNNNDTVPSYYHKDGIVAKAKRDYQLRMLAIDGWLTYVEDVTIELENSFDIERQLRMKAISDIEALENDIRELEQDPYYNALTNLNNTKDEIYKKEDKDKHQKGNSPKLNHTVVHMSTGVYTGDLIHGYKDGKGRMVYSENDELYRKEYVGDFKNDKNHGKGRMIYISGDIYDGHWKEGTYHGLGKYSWDNGNYYEGEWKNGNMSGYGIFNYRDGDFYEGNFYDDLRHGYGTLVSSNGAIYEGEWDKNFRSGKGKLQLPNGEIYEGTFKDNYYIPNII
jgi:hypothetical protein